MIFEEGGEGPTSDSSIVAPYGQAVQKNQELEQNGIVPKTGAGVVSEAFAELFEVFREVGDDALGFGGDRGKGFLATGENDCVEGGADMGVVGIRGTHGADKNGVREQDQLGLVLEQELLGDFDVGVGRLGGGHGDELFVLAGFEQKLAIEGAGDRVFPALAAALGADIGIERGAGALGFTDATNGAAHVQLSALRYWAKPSTMPSMPGFVQPCSMPRMPL